MTVRELYAFVEEKMPRGDFVFTPTIVKVASCGGV